MTVALFGAIQLGDPASLTVGVAMVIGVLICLELIFEKLEAYAEKHDFLEIFNKLKHELMILGFISFIVFLIQSATLNYPKITTSEYFISFEMAHLTILFMAFSFITQAIVLVNFANRDGKEFLKMVNRS